jgi:hypothetical protein
VRHARALLPYLAAAAVIAAGSTALVFATIEGGAAPIPTATGPPGSAPALSENGRLAYWRQNPSGDYLLWVANLDGSRARPITTVSRNAPRPFLTRWTADGGAVAFVSADGLSRIALDGSKIDVILPAATRTAGFRIIEHRWSKSGTKVAATAYRSSDGKADVHFASVERRDLSRPADLGNTYVGDWLSEDEVLVESERGVVGALREAGTLRRLTDTPAGSPVLSGGRVFFLAGPISTSGEPRLVFVSNPSVWSVLPDGMGARRESRLEVGGPMRLDGRWPDGRYLVHLSQDRNQFLAGPRATVFSNAPSALQRVTPSADGRVAIAVSNMRLYRIDLTRGFTPDEGAFLVLLDGVLSPDTWVRSAPIP